ncbi:conserved phage C-terminal domain-containing protein [Staphylococcus equorum]|uniref:conserved phage C-terminal domain-containing protein n=1 Tax=Staphylococcus equorum TaxID=246432 RepID=UPI003CEFDC82
MGIIRASKTTGKFFIASKHYVEDSELSWRSKGVMSYLFSKPDDWVIYQSHLESVSTDGKHGVRATINELLEKGYMTRTKRRKENGIFDGYDYTLHEFPNENNRVRFTADGKPDDGKSDTTNNELITKNNNTKNKASGNPTIPYQEIIKYLNTKTKKNFRNTSVKTRKLIEARYNQKFNIDDFKKVIDNMTTIWINDEKMNTYLRPETLFGTKFESYLNQTPNTAKREQPKNTKQPKSESDNWLDKKRMEILGG